MGIHNFLMWLFISLFSVVSSLRAAVTSLCCGVYSLRVVVT